jgi:hypothetical protein
MSVDTSGRLCVLTLVMLPLLITTKSHTRDELLKTRRSLTTSTNFSISNSLNIHPTHTLSHRRIKKKKNGDPLEIVDNCSSWNNVQGSRVSTAWLATATATDFFFFFFLLQRKAHTHNRSLVQASG